MPSRIDAVRRNDSGNILAGFLTEQELADQLHLTTRTLWRWRYNRKGPDVTVVGRRVLYSRESVKRWLATRERKMVRQKRSTAT